MLYLYCSSPPHFTVQKLINQDKVVLDSFFVKFAEIAASNIDNAVTKLKNHGSVGVPLCYCNDIQILMSHVKERRRAKSDDWRSYIGVRDDLNAKDIGNRPSTTETWLGVSME